MDSTAQVGTFRTTTSRTGVVVGSGKGEDAAVAAVINTQETREGADAEVTALKEQIAALQAQVRNSQGRQAVPEQPTTNSCGTTAVRNAFGVMVPSQPQTVQSFGSYGDRCKDIKDKAVRMARAGQLFIQQEPGGPLVRAKAFDLFNSLEYGQGGLVYVVDRLADHQSGSSSSSSSHRQYDTHGIFHYGSEGSFSNSSTSEGNTSVDFNSRPLFNWASFADWTTEDGRGVPNTYLPGPAGNAQTAHWFSSSSSSGWHDQMSGPFHDRDNGGYSSASYWEN